MFASNVTANILSAPDWETAAREVIYDLIESGKCFSSGEVAAILRSTRPSLRFGVRGLGVFIRAEFGSGNLPDYPDDGNGDPTYPVQVSRYADGTGRTPKDQLVFVYAPTREAGEGHDFEIPIPAPPQQLQDDISSSTAAAAAAGDGDGGNVSTGPVSGHGPTTPPPSAKGGTYPATIAFDNRCYVGKKAIVACDPNTKAFKAKWENKKVTLTPTDEKPKRGSVFKVWTQGRVAFTLPFLPNNTTYHAEVSNGSIIVDFN